MTSALYAVSIVLMLAVPLLLAVLLRRRLKTYWLYFVVGALAFILSQVYHIPLNRWLAGIGVIVPIAPDAPNLLATAAVLGLSAALSEGLMRLLAFWLLRRNGLARHWQDAVMVGLGHGGVEAMFTAALAAASVGSLLALQNSDLAALNLGPEQTAALTRQMAMVTNSPLLAFAPLVERLGAITLHVAVSLLIWLAFERRNALYAFVGILYHALVDATIVYAAQFIENPWLLEGAFWLMVLPGLFFIGWSYRRLAVSDEGFRPRPLPEEWRLFLVQTRKELAEQWRTWRVAVVIAVFLLFGLTSPLLARFTSDLLRGIPEAAQFAELIPEPSTADAIGQYLRNLTQFGFILVILLGMSAIAGEKERGTAAIVLSKPLPRWAFVSGKFTAQALVYLLAVLVAAGSTAFYTSLLFEPLETGPFLFGAVLLWLWLLAYAAVTLLGSALGRTVLIAAGLGLAGCVALLAAGSLPLAGAILPSGLLAWISGLGLGGEVTATWGALVGTIAVIVLCVMSAVAVVERQEI